MMSTTPASLYALVINALLFIGFYTKMRCPQIALTFSGDSSFEVQLLFIKTSQECSECDLVCQFVICRFFLYPERLYNSGVFRILILRVPSVNRIFPLRVPTVIKYIKITGAK